MGIPDYQSVMLPLLRYASDTEEHKIRDATEYLAEEFKLSEEERKELLPSGQQAIFKNRVGWASTYLKKAGLLDSRKKGYFTITQRGKNVLKEKPASIDVNFLKKYGEFNEFYNKDKKPVIEKPAIGETEETEEQIDINLETEDTGMVIGYHGDTLEALQLIMSLCIAKELGEFKRVSLEIGGYKKSREEWLNNLAMETKERVLSENREVSLRELKSWERRIVHLALKDDESVLSESIGEGKDRMLVVKPR